MNDSQRFLIQITIIFIVLIVTSSLLIFARIMLDVYPLATITFIIIFLVVCWVITYYVLGKKEKEDNQQ